MYGPASSTLNFSSTLITVKLGARNMHIRAFAMDCFFEVFRFQLAMLVIAVRLLDGYSDSVEHIRGFLEDSIHFFQGAVASFGEEEVDKGEDESVSMFVSCAFIGIGISGLT